MCTELRIAEVPSGVLGIWGQAVEGIRLVNRNKEFDADNGAAAKLLANEDGGNVVSYRSGAQGTTFVSLLQKTSHQYLAVAT